jgi:outer membrane immunogenic protein
MEMRFGLPVLAAIVVAVSAPAGAQTPPVSIPATDFGPVWTGFYVVMGRVGYLPVPSTLIYAAGGYSQLNVHGTVSTFLPGSSFSSRDTAFSGFTVGPGIETVVTDGWTTRLEYRFSQFEQKEVAAGVNMQPSNHTIHAGLSYKFGMGPGVSTAQASD